jgi:predicted NAD/FAD-dependent oxidoreductase
MATRTLTPEAMLDYGAQHLAALPGIPTTALASWFDDPEGRTRYKPVPSFRALAQLLAQGLPFHTERRVATIRREPGRWLLTFEDGHTESVHRLVVTVPVPQVLPLFETPEAVFTQQEQANLAAVRYEPCLTALILLATPLSITGATHGFYSWPEHPVVFSVTDNQAKGLSGSPALTIQSTGTWAEHHYTDPDTSILEALTQATNTLLNTHLDWAARPSEVKRWRYSRVAAAYPGAVGYLCPQTSPTLWLAGDGFTESSVFKAWHSGTAVGKAVAAAITQQSDEHRTR